MKFDKQELEKKIRDAKDLSNEDKLNLLQLLIEKRRLVKYGHRALQLLHLQDS